MSIRNSQRRLAVLAGVLTLAATACGGGEQDFEPIAAEDPGPIHVHGLGINPKDGALFIATHTGLYRLARGESKAKRVGDRFQDTMGFTVAGPDRFLGSGHPDLREAREKDLPPHLGLIESRDAGLTWTPVSLLGEADFHILRFAGDRVYGFDSTGARVMASDDDGKSWVEERPPAPLVDLVADPSEPAHLLASTETELFESQDGGATWRRLGARAGFLAWPAEARLLLLDPGGALLVSRDAGKEWEVVGATGGEPAALLAQSERELYVALHDGTILVSEDGGASWAVRSRP